MTVHQWSKVPTDIVIQRSIEAKDPHEVTR